jgi:heme A synthase
MARAAGRFAGRWMPTARAVAQKAAKQAEAHSSALNKSWVPAAKQSGQFVKHVVPAAVKPLHALWHQILGFTFLVFAGLAAWKLWRAENTAPPMFALAVVFILVMAAYGISSIVKSNRISRS